MTYDRAPAEMDVFNQLKPIYGSKIDQLWIAYMAGTPRDKAEIIQYLNLLAIKVQHKRIGDRKIYLEPPRPDVIGGGDYELGKVVFPGRSPCSFTIHREELLRHALFDGPSGSGKTTLILNLMAQIQGDGIPWLALDWKRSFRVLMHAPRGEGVLVLSLTSEEAPLRVNMLLPPPGVSTTAWVENVSDTICTGYALLDGARSKLKGVFLDALSMHKDRATLRDALALLRQDFVRIPKGSRNYGWMESTERALNELVTGPFGDCLNERDHPMLIGDLLERSVVIELEGLGRAQGVTLSIFFLQCTLLTRQKQSGPREVLRHVTVIDEAQNIFRREAQWEPLSLPSRTIREVREYGEACICATQDTSVSDSLLSNTGTKLIMRTNSKWDLDYFSKSFQIDPYWLTIIPNGQGIGVIPGRYVKPFLFSFPQNKLKNITVTEDEIVERYEEYRNGKTTAPANSAAPMIVVGEKERALLLSIAKNPLFSITTHYDHHGWNPKTGNTIKDRLLRGALIRLEQVEHGRTRMKFPVLTKEGEAILGQDGITPQALGTGSKEHEYWRNEVQTRCAANGYAVTTEYPIGPCRVDLHAARGDKTFLIEVETGKSDVLKNIDKCAGHGTLIMLFTSKNAHDTHRDHIPKDVIILTTETIQNLNQILK